MSRSIQIIPGHRSQTCATATFANTNSQTVFDGNIVCTNPTVITNKQIQSNGDVQSNKTKVQRAVNSILYATSGKTMYGKFSSPEQLQKFLQENQTNPEIYSPYVGLNPNSPQYQYYNNYSTQPNRIPGIRNRF